mmetsp:Transcript_1613/g.3641  ORF Transcript_1613/g.3641 Transcript_1613/m.3641 type:complete len:81 (+) Transcript_1613:151-393(+)
MGLPFKHSARTHSPSLGRIESNRASRTATTSFCSIGRRQASGLVVSNRPSTFARFESALVRLEPVEELNTAYNRRAACTS